MQRYVFTKKRYMCKQYNGVVIYGVIYFHIYLALKVEYKQTSSFFKENGKNISFFNQNSDSKI